jgi:hypothetical protein
MNVDQETLKDVFSFFKVKYPELKQVKLEFTPYTNKYKYQGRSHIDVIGSFENNGKNRYKKIKPLSIELIDGYSNILFTLLHEIAHCITKYRERKIKEEWVILDHGDDFYKSYHDILNYAYEKKIIQKKFSLNEIKKFDKMC